MVIACVNEPTALSSIHFCSRMPKKTYESVRSNGRLTRKTTVGDGACHMQTLVPLNALDSKITIRYYPRTHVIFAGKTKSNGK